MNKLSVCIIAKNEEKLLAGCIESVQSIADEIVLVDTGSQDATVDIAKSYNCKVVYSEWQDDFSFSRNVALEHAKGDFILIIDADERLVDPDKLRNVIDNANSQVGGWLLEVVSSVEIDSNSNQQFVSNLLRLFRNHPEIKFEGVIHEQVVDSVFKLGYKLANTDIMLNHIGYDLPSDSIAKKNERNLRLLNKSLQKEPNNTYNLTQRAKTLHALQRYDEAHNDFIKVMEILPKNEKMRVRALNFGAMNAYKFGNKDLAKQWAEESLELIKNQAMANFILGEISFESKDYPQAYQFFSNMRKSQISPTETITAIIGDYFIPLDHLAYKIGRCLFLMKDYSAAADEYSESFRLNNHNVLGLIGLSNIAFNLQKYEDAKNMLETARQISPDTKEIHQFLAQVEQATKVVTQKENQNIPQRSNGQTKLSIAMIVKNEEQMLPDCLESVKSVADEIIVVDTGSIDKTVEVAQRYGAKVYNFKWIEDFAAARNESLKYCTGDWILYIDADERLSAESIANIKNYLDNVLPEIGALICTIESVHFKMDGSNELHRGGYPRLFKNLGYPKVKFVGRVHEQISPSIVDAGYNFAVSDIKILHLGYDQSREVMEQKIKRNYKMLLAHVNEEPLNGYAWFQLGQTLAQMGLFKEAEDAIRFSLNCDLSKTIYASAAATLSQLVGNRSEFEESLMWAEKSLEKAPNQLFAFTLKAFALLKLNRYAEASAIFKQALQLQSGGTTTIGLESAGFDVAISRELLENGLKQANDNLNL